MFTYGYVIQSAKLVASVETGYASVRKWTSKINIFEKKYLVIPINEKYVIVELCLLRCADRSPSFHWYLAIVYEPGRVLQPLPPSQTRQSTRLKGDKPDINLADSQSSKVELQAVAESADAVTAFVKASTHESGVAHDVSSASRTARDVSEEMEVDEMVLNPITGGDSPLSEPDITLDIPRSSSPPEGRVDVNMEDVSLQAGPSRAPSSSAETLDDSAAVDGGRDTGASKPSHQLANGVARDGGVDAPRFYAQAPPPPRPNAKGKGKERAQPDNFLDFEDDAIPSHVESIDIDMTLEDTQPAEDDTPANPDEPPPAYVFTFDSLGGRHPAAGKKLGQYLHLEAHDKQGKDIQTLSPWKYLVAQVSL